MFDLEPAEESGTIKWATDCISSLHLVLLVTSLLLRQVILLPKMVRDLKVYFCLLAESANWIIKVLFSLFETPKRKEITRTDLGIERK